MQKEKNRPEDQKQINKYLITLSIRKMDLKNHGEHNELSGVDTNVFCIDKNKIFLLFIYYLITIHHFRGKCSTKDFEDLKLGNMS